MQGLAPRILLSPPTVGSGEREALLRAFDSGWIAPQGPEVDAFEIELRAVTDAGRVVALSSGTAALHLALLLSGVTADDHVLVQSLTFAATANAVHYIGARPVFIDSAPDTWTIDPSLVASYLASCSKLPGAVVAVDIFGQCADYDALAQVCAPYGVPLISDAAEALGATYKGRCAGGLTDFGVLSFNGNKIISTSGGGALTTRDPDMAARATHLATQARMPAAHYEHDEVGYNYRLSNLLAALGRAQLARLPQFVAHRRALRAGYAKALTDCPGVALMPEATYGESNAWLSVLTVDPAVAGTTASDLRLALDEANIESRPIWKPMHLQPLHAMQEIVGGEVSAQLFAQGLCLPSGSSLCAADHERVIDTIRRALL